VCALCVRACACVYSRAPQRRRGAQARCRLLRADDLSQELQGERLCLWKHSSFQGERWLPDAVAQHPVSNSDKMCAFKAEHMHPNWDYMEFIACCSSTSDAISPPPELSNAIAALFFPNGRAAALDISEKSAFKYAQELRELLPAESQKGHLTFQDVESAFLRLTLSYTRRTSRLQSYGNRMFRQILAHRVICTQALPEHLFASNSTDAEEVDRWNVGFDLVQEQDNVESPAEGLLLRTATTCAEVLAQPLTPDVLQWEDKTTQLCHFLLHKLFGLPNVVQPGCRVCLTGLKSEWLNGAEGTVEERQPNGRYFVRLLLPQSAVEQAIRNSGSARVQILPDNMMRYASETDTFSLRRLQDAAERLGQPGAQVMLDFAVCCVHVSCPLTVTCHRSC